MNLVDARIMGSLEEIVPTGIREKINDAGREYRTPAKIVGALATATIYLLANGPEELGSLGFLISAFYGNMLVGGVTTAFARSFEARKHARKNSDISFEIGEWTYRTQRAL